MSGTDRIIIDIQSALYDFGNKNITEIIAQLYDYGIILEYLTRCLLPAVPRKAGVKEFKLYRTVSQINQITMCIIGIMMKSSRISPGKRQEQCH